MEDIADRAPDFYSFKSGSGSYGNERRVFYLQDAVLPEGVVLSPRNDTGQRLLELKTAASDAKRVIMFSSKHGSKVMPVPEACPHFRLEQTCNDGRVAMNVTVDGTLACYRGISGELKLGGTGIPVGAVARAGDVLPVSASGGTFVTVEWRTETLFSGPVGENQFQGATLGMLVGVLQHGDDATAFKVFEQMDPAFVTEEVRTKVSELRLARFRDQVARQDFLLTLQTTVLDERFPGSTQIRALVEQKLAEEMERLVKAQPSGPDFWRGLAVIEQTQHVQSLPVHEFADKYGAFIANLDFQNESQNVREAADEFLRRWPESEWSAVVREKRGKATAERQAAREAAQHESDLNYTWSEIAEVGNLIVSWQYKVGWLREYGPKIRRTEIGISNMQAGIRMKKQEFCALKKEFLKTGTAAEFKERAKEHCDSEAPVEDLGSGEVDLTKQCRAQFASGC